MLLTLNTTSLRSLLAPKRGKPTLSLLDVPAFTRETLGLHGLNVTTDLLKGADRAKLAEFRDRADQAACACLLLIEPTPQPFAAHNEDKGEQAIIRTERVIEAAHILGCNAASISLSGQDDDEAFSLAVDRLQIAIEAAERRELNLLISPGDGITSEPDKVTELIKRVGRFRLMTFPDFATAAASGDAEAYLKRLTPYAGAVNASLIDFEVVESDDSELEKAAEMALEELAAEFAAATSKAVATDNGDAGSDGTSKAKSDGKPDAEPSADVAGDKKADGDDDEPIDPFAVLQSEHVEHLAFPIAPMIETIKSVGFDGSLAIEYRGKEDPVIGVAHAKAALEAAIELAEQG